MSSTSLVASAVSVSDSKELGCELLPSARSSHTPAPSCESTGPTSLAMTTCEPSPLTALTQTELFPMSSVAASPARISARPARELGLKALVAAYGRNTPELLARFDPASSSWKTSQHSLEGGFTEFSETWPRSGMTRSGTAFVLPTLVPLTSAIGSGLLPTPTVVYTRENWTPAQITARQVEVKAATEAKGKHQTGNGFGLNLAQAIRHWPTPSARDWKGAPSSLDTLLGNSRPLNEVVRFYTPTARDHMPVHKPEYIAAKKAQGHGMGNLNDQIGGMLNPTWVEWLMGFPPEWTVLSASEMPSSRKSRKSSVKP